MALNNLGRAYDDLGKKQEALEHYNLALPLNRALGDRRGEAITLDNLGNVHSALGEEEEALKSFNLALSLRRAIGDRRGEATTLDNLMFLFEATTPALSVVFGKQSVNRYQELRANIQTLDKSIQRTFRQSVEDTYRNLASILISQGRIPEAEAVRALLEDEEYFHYLRRNEKLAAALGRRLDLTAAEQRAIAEYEKLGERLTQIGAEWAKLDEQRKRLPANAAFPAQTRLDELDAQLKDSAQAMQVFFKQLAESFGKNSRDERVTEVAAGLKAALKSWGVKNTVVIAAYPSQDGLALVVTTPVTQEARMVEIKAAELSELVAAFRKDVTDACACRDPKDSGLRLYEKLVKPLEGDLRGAEAKTLVWLMDGVLNYVPVAALWDGKQYLAERFDNVMMSFNSREHLAVPPQPASRWRALGAGVSKKWGDFEPLPAVPAELESIIREETAKRKEAAGVLPGRKLLDAAFDQKNWKAELGRYRVIHIASHFSFSPGKEKGSFLLMGDGSHYLLEDMQSSTPIFDGVELLALSACNTAMGESNGSEIKGFGRLAQEQGARSVLATLWAVADESTAKLMRTFYQQRLGNAQQTKAAALTRSQLALLRGEIKADGLPLQRTAKMAGESSRGTFKPFQTDASKPYAHPYFWAPFILIGNWR